MDALLTVILSAVQSFGIAIGLQEVRRFRGQSRLGFILMTMLTLTTGSAFIMWLGEQITERGIGNGMSLLIFAGIVVGLPRGVADLIDKAKNAAWGALTVPADGFWSSSWCWWWRSSCTWNAASGAFRCNTPSAWWDAR